MNYQAANRNMDMMACEEEEDVDMGGMFGGDDDDYGCEEEIVPQKRSMAKAAKPMTK